MSGGSAHEFDRRHASMGRVERRILREPDRIVMQREAEGRNRGAQRRGQHPMAFRHDWPPFQPLRMPPITSDTMNRTRKMKNRIFAMPTAPAAMPPKPKTPATNAMRENTAAQ